MGTTLRPEVRLTNKDGKTFVCEHHIWEFAKQCGAKENAVVFARNILSAIATMRESYSRNQLERLALFVEDSGYVKVDNQEESNRFAIKHNPPPKVIDPPRFVTNTDKRKRSH